MSHRFRSIQKFHSDGIETNWRLRLLSASASSCWLTMNRSRSGFCTRLRSPKVSTQAAISAFASSCPLFGRAAMSYVAREQRCRFEVAGPATPHVAFAQLTKRHGYQVGRRLHDARVVIAQTPGQIALQIDWIVVLNVKL